MEYNVIDVINELLEQGYSEEQAEIVACYGNYNIPLEELMSENI